MIIHDHRDIGAFIPSFLDDYPLDPVEFRVYCRVARRAGTGTCYESVSSMAQGAGVGERRIREALRLLVAARLLRVVDDRPLEERDRPTGRPTVYVMTSADEWVEPDQLPQLRANAKRTRNPGRTDRVGPHDRGQGRSPRPDGVGPQERTGSVPTTGRGRSPRTDEGTPTKGIPLRASHEGLDRRDATVTAELADRLADRIAALPGMTRPDITTWPDDMASLILTAARGTPDDVDNVRAVRAVIDYATGDEFWSGIIGHPKHIRKHWDRLWPQTTAAVRQQRQRRPSAPSQHPREGSITMPARKRRNDQ